MLHDTRIWMVGLVLACAPLLAACDDDDQSEPTPTPTTSESATPEPGPEPTTETLESAQDLVGTWRDDAVDWTVHFAEDGTYTVDFEGHVDFLNGTYTMVDDVVTLTGGDGNEQVGQITGEGIEFRLGTLTKR